MNLNSVKTEITVDGKSCDFNKVTLKQSLIGHHTFEIEVSYRYKEKSVWAITVEDIFKDTLNKPVFIKMTHIENGETNEFEGVVTDIDAVGFNGDVGTIILRGGSPTILLDRDPSIDSFIDYNLYSIVAETIENTGVKVNLENKPHSDLHIPYVARHKETSYAFLSRVCAAYGEWFYYDGKKLVIGKPADQNAIKVKFDVELYEVRSTAKLRNLNTRYYDYNSSRNNHFEEESGTIHRPNFPMFAVKKVSEPIYPTQSVLPTDRAIIDEGDMTRAVRTKHSRKYVSASQFTACSNTCAIRVGEIAIVTLPKMKDVFFTDLGAFLVTEIEHIVENNNNHYKNTFTGIVGATETLPDDHIVMPVALPEPAIVVDNNDPKKQGRVKVRYFWQDSIDKSASTNWIRVQTPDAGKSDNVPTNRGMWFIPEKDDQVMIGFEKGDPSRPYVMGSLFHRDTTHGIAADNDIKSITTRSGAIIEFNDKEGSIKLFSAKGNSMVFLDGKGNVSISTPKTFTVSASDINLNAGNSINLSAKPNEKSKGEGTFNLVAEKSVSLSSETDSVTVTAAETLSIESQNADVAIKAGADMSINATDITVSGSGSVKVSSSDTNIM